MPVTAQGLFKLADINMEKRRMERQGKLDDESRQLRLGQERREQETFELTKPTLEAQRSQALKNLQMLNLNNELEAELSRSMKGAPPMKAFNFGWEKLNELSTNPKYQPILLNAQKKFLQDQMSFLEDLDKRDPSKKLSTSVYNSTIGEVIGHKIDKTEDLPEGTIAHGWFKSPDGQWLEKTLLTPKGGGAPIDVTDRYGTASGPDKSKETWREVTVMRGGKPTIVERNNLGQERVVGDAPPKAGVVINTGQAVKPVATTTGEKALDRVYAKEYSDYVAAGGASEIWAQLENVKQVANALIDNPNLTGSVVGNTPDVVLKAINPEAVDVREKLQSAIQGTLRATLGAQFTEKEGIGIMNRAFNPSLPAETNRKRVEALFNKLSKMAEMKEASAAYFEENGTLAGFKGKLPSRAMLESDKPIKASSSRGESGITSISDEELLKALNAD